MKKYIFITYLLLLGYTVWAQETNQNPNALGVAPKIAVIDIQKIINQIPEFKSMQDDLASLSQNWSMEIDSLRSEVEIAKNNLNAERFLLTSDLIKKREEDLLSKEMQITTLQRQYFASTGIVSTKRKNTMDQIMQQIYSVITDIAQQDNLSLVLDKMNGESVIYFDPAIDITQRVLNSLRGAYEQ
ncbi:MAG: OmpH family outer membrane protein [Chitinophagaceae bacterium]